MGLKNVLIAMSLVVTACDGEPESLPEPDGGSGKSDSDTNRTVELCQGLVSLFGDATSEQNAIETFGRLSGECAEPGEPTAAKLHWKTWYSCATNDKTSTGQYHSKTYYGDQFVAAETVTLTQGIDGGIEMRTVTAYGDGEQAKLTQLDGEVMLSESSLDVVGRVMGDCPGAEPGSIAECEMEFSSTLWRSEKGLQYEGDALITAGVNEGAYSTASLSSDPSLVELPNCS